MGNSAKREKESFYGKDKENSQRYWLINCLCGRARALVIIKSFPAGRI